ncbi:hypothetical protein [Levilactobacillus brevis]|uniref:hypothetical protein n=1 Tax=Levilactobacillus brevis TaxID=1580 RepID=UPI0007609002|nr:hypothetical protein [Levilactobacillus brevis]MCT3566687.1 hypothetical protein [Levilactobacillus brevis]ORJ54163.1 hypothetical protein LBR_09575 [Levilactobacillus brevis]
MSKELYFTDGNNEVKYLDTTASFNLAITQDGSAFDLTNATAIDVKVANDTGYVFDKSIDMTTITQPLAGLITMPVDAEVMNALVPDDYTIEVWVTLSSLVTPGSQEGLTDDGSTTENTTPTTTTYNAIFPSDDPQGFSITDNVMSDSGDVIPVMSLDAFQQEFDQLKTDLTNQVSTLQGPAGKDGENGKDGATGPQGPQGIQGPKGDTGQGLEIKGKVDTTSQLPATASEGDGYLVAEELYVWTDNEWKDCGQIQGPAGKDGKDGATGPQGPQGPAGKDGTQVDLSNYATQQQLATKADTSAIDPSVLAKTTLTADDDVLTLDPGTYYTWGVKPKNFPALVSWSTVVVKAVGNQPIDGKNVTITDTNASQLVNTYSGSDSTGKWSGWRVPNSTTMASKTDVTTAVSTATANMVDSSKVTNFTAGLQSGGVDVATAADLKSIENSAWRQLDNKYISTKPTSNTTISSDTVILYKLDTDNKRIYLQGTILISSTITNNLSTSVSIDFSSIAKTISFASGYYALQYWGNSPSTLYGSTLLNDKLTMYSTSSGYLSISNLSSSSGSQSSTLAYVTYDELV